MLKEFRDFIARGNVLDLAVAVIIGAAFATITASLTDDIIMPIVGAIFGGLDFANYFIALSPIPAGVAHTLDAVKKAGVPVIAWGNFTNIVINFVILAFVVFLMVKQINRLRRAPPPAAPAAPPEDVVLLREIRDSLRQR